MLISLFILSLYGIITKNLLLNNSFAPFFNFLLFITGSILYLPYHFNNVQFLLLDKINKNIIMEIFVPILLFHSGYSVNVHIFVNLWKIILLLALPILTINSLIYATIYSSIFNNNFNAVLIVAFILAATDPISVVSTLKNIGAPKQLEMILDGESLLNDGISLFLFNFAEGYYFQEMTINKTFYTLISSILLSPLFGIIIGIIVKNIIGKTNGNSLYEKGLVITFVYLSFMIPELLKIGMSGVISVVFYGLYMSYKGKYYMKEEGKVDSAVEFLGGIFEMFVFYSSGFIFADAFFKHWKNIIILKTLIVFILLNIIRITLTMLLSLIKLTHYSFDRKSYFFIGYSSARGAITMSMGLSLLFKTYDLNEKENSFFVEQMLIVFGVVMMSILINGGLSDFVYKKLGIKNTKYWQKQDMQYYKSILNTKTQEKIEQIFKKKFYSFADIKKVKRLAFIGKKEELDTISENNFNIEFRNCNRNYLHALHHLYNFEFRHKNINKIVIFYLQEAIENALDHCERNNIEDCADIIQYEYNYLKQYFHLDNFILKYNKKPFIGRIVRLYIYNRIYLFYQIKKNFITCHYKVLEELQNISYDYLRGYINRYEIKMEHEFDKILKQYPDIVKEIATREYLKEIYTNKNDILMKWMKHGKIDKNLGDYLNNKIENGFKNIKNMAPSFYV